MASRRMYPPSSHEPRSYSGEDESRSGDYGTADNDEESWEDQYDDDEGELSDSISTANTRPGQHRPRGAPFRKRSLHSVSSRHSYIRPGPAAPPVNFEMRDDYGAAYSRSYGPAPPTSGQWYPRGQPAPSYPPSTVGGYRGAPTYQHGAMVPFYDHVPFQRSHPANATPYYDPREQYANPYPSAAARRATGPAGPADGYYSSNFQMPMHMQNYLSSYPPAPPTEVGPPARTTPAPPAEVVLSPEMLKIQAELESFKEEKRKKAELEEMKAREEKIKQEAEIAFKQRMEDMKRAQEEARKEIEKAKKDAEIAALERLEAQKEAEEKARLLHAEAMKRAEQDARERIQAELRANAERAKAEAEARKNAEAAAQAKFEANLAKAAKQRAAEEEAKKAAEEATQIRIDAAIRAEAEKKAAAEEARKIAEAAAEARLQAAIKAAREAEAAAAKKAAEEESFRKQLAEEARLKAEVEARAKLAKEKEDAEAAAAAAAAKKLEEEELKKRIEEATRVKIRDEAKNKAPIKFKDAVGRKFSFPFHLCQTWTGMDELIKQAFLHVDVIGPSVQDGQFDLMGANGEIILPQVWDKVIAPDAQITMVMWPTERTRPRAMPHDFPHAFGGRHARDPRFPPGAIPSRPGVRLAHGPPPMGGRQGRGMPIPPQDWPPRPVPGGSRIPPDVQVITADKDKRSKKAGNSGILNWMTGAQPPKKKKGKK